MFLNIACSPTETITDTGEADTLAEESAVPDWYSSDVYSSADSLFINGFAMASAADSVQAAGYATQSAEQNLRFEIDRITEDARRKITEEGNDEYAATAFIIRLRNIIRDLPLASADFTYEHEATTDGVHYIYSRATLHRSDLIALLETELTDAQFLEKINNY